jgi:dTDP-4-amino-4,6-dideoxygalactose transaminase
VRRYFYPLISDFPMYRGLPSAAHANLPVAHKLSQQILCLPIYPELALADVDRVVAILKDRGG